MQLNLKVKIMKKVIVEISGGLGNQMFMYATGRALALRVGGELILDYDNSGKKDFYGRTFELNKFNIKGKRSNFYSYNYPLGKILKKISRRLGRHIPCLNIKNVSENKSFDFDSDILSITNSCHLSGYWQSELYFKDFENVIRQDFVFLNPMSHKVLDEKEQILNLNDRAVALCVRRYQEVKQFGKLKLTEVDYYKKAIIEIQKRVPNPVFFCFSQTPLWVKEMLEPLGIEIRYITPKQGENASIEDLYLMMNFKNFILSNSTYYWWGAWLSSRSDKLIISPNNWCCNKSNCDGWIIIE